MIAPSRDPIKLQPPSERWNPLDHGQRPRPPSVRSSKMPRGHAEGQIIKVREPTNEIQDISSVPGRVIEVERVQRWNEVCEVSIEVFKETWGVEPIYGKFLDPVETLEVVDKRLEVGRGKVLVNVDGEVASIR